MGECEVSPIRIDCTELGVHGIVQNTVRYESWPDHSILANLVRRSIHLKHVDETPGGTLYKEVAYLLRGVHNTAVSGPTIHFQKFGLILKREFMANNIPRCSCPFKKLVTFRLSSTWDKPLSSNGCVKLDAVRVAIVGGNLHGEVGKRDRLVY